MSETFAIKKQSPGKKHGKETKKTLISNCNGLSIAVGMDRDLLAEVTSIEDVTNTRSAKGKPKVLISGQNLTAVPSTKRLVKDTFSMVKLRIMRAQYLRIGWPTFPSMKM